MSEKEPDLLIEDMAESLETLKKTLASYTKDIQRIDAQLKTLDQKINTVETLSKDIQLKMSTLSENQAELWKVIRGAS